MIGFFKTCSQIFKRFGRDTRGQVAFLGIVAAIPLTLLLFTMVNNSKALQDSTRAQTAADMIALAHAAEAARSMNTLAMNHVSLTQNFTTAVNASSLDNTIKIHRLVLIGAGIETGAYALKTCKKYKAIPIAGTILYAICWMPSVAFLARLTAEGVRNEMIKSTYKPKDALEVANNALTALTVNNKEVIDRFPGVVEKQAAWIAKTNKVTDLYFDNSCEQNIASSCDSSNKRQGMELPVRKNEPLDAHLRFCAATFFGTGGVPLGGIPGLGSLPGMSNFMNIPVMNGSFHKRGFEINRGPMNGGDDEDNYLPTHISKLTDMGQALVDYDKMATDKNLYDGVLNLLLSPIQGASIVSSAISASFAVFRRGKKKRKAKKRAQDYFDNITQALVINGTTIEKYPGAGFKYPFDQELDDNMFTRQVNLRTAAQCAGANSGGGLLGNIASFASKLSGLVGMSKVADFDVYHVVQDGSIPKILPGIDTFDDDYKPLAIVHRKSNKRWSPGIFKDPNDGFVKYSQAITYNKDEIGLYSQNWQARLIPSTKMQNLSDILSRMDTKATETFNDLKEDLRSVEGEASWGNLVVR